MSEQFSTIRRGVPVIERAALLLKIGETDCVGELLDLATVLAGEDLAQRGRILALQLSFHQVEALYDEAARCAKEAIALFRGLGDTVAEIAVRSQVARVFLAVGNTQEALAEALAQWSKRSRSANRRRSFRSSWGAYGCSRTLFKPRAVQ